MLLGFFLKLFLISAVFSLLAFAFLPETGLLFLAKSIAFGTALCVLITFVYPYIRGVKSGDTVVLSSSLPFFVNKVGKAINGARKNDEIRVRFEDGEEAAAILESYEGFLSPPKIRVLYEERLRE